MLSPNPTKQKQEKQNLEQEAQSRTQGDRGTKDLMGGGLQASGDGSLGPVLLRPLWPVSHSSTPTCLGEKHKGTQWHGTVQSRTRLRETIFDTKWLCDPVQVTSVSVTSLLRREDVTTRGSPKAPLMAFSTFLSPSSGSGFRHKWGGYFTRGNWTECDLLSLKREKLRPFGDWEEASLRVHSPSAVSPSSSGKLPPVQMALWVV